MLGRAGTHLIYFYDYIERFLSVLTDPVSDDWDKLRIRLPKSYINFDKKYIDILIGICPMKRLHLWIGALRQIVILGY